VTRIATVHDWFEAVPFWEICESNGGGANRRAAFFFEESTTFRRGSTVLRTLISTRTLVALFRFVAV
jgi:hypothetical protein